MVLGFNHFDVDATSIFYGLPLIIYIYCNIHRLYNKKSVRDIHYTIHYLNMVIHIL